jgi:hypothetical protein
MTGRKLNANALASDIRGGLDDNAVMEKYDLSTSQLQNAVGQLLQARLITESHLSSNLNHKLSEAERHHPLPIVAQVRDKSDAQGSAGKCPHCGTARTRGDVECSHCGIFFSKAEQICHSPEPTSIAPGHLDPELQTGTYHDLILGSFYEEIAEAHEKKRKKRLWIVCSAVALGLIPIPFALLGYSRQIMLTYTVGCALFVFLYYLVVVYYAAQQSRFLGLLCIGFSPVAILFVILNWNTVFAGKLLPRLWLALMVPLTAISLLAKFGHLRIFPCG